MPAKDPVWLELAGNYRVDTQFALWLPLWGKNTQKGPVVPQYTSALAVSNSLMVMKIYLVLPGLGRRGFASIKGNS